MSRRWCTPGPSDPATGTGDQGDTARGGEVILDQPAEGGAVAGSRKYHEANEFRLGGLGFYPTHHQHRQRKIGRVHGR